MRLTTEDWTKDRTFVLTLEEYDGEITVVARENGMLAAEIGFFSVKDNGMIAFDLFNGLDSGDFDTDEDGYITVIRWANPGLVQMDESYRDTMLVNR